jgi:hypothetical protein
MQFIIIHSSSRSSMFSLFTQIFPSADYFIMEHHHYITYSSFRVGDKISHSCKIIFRVIVRYISIIMLLDNSTSSILSTKRLFHRCCNLLSKLHLTMLKYITIWKCKFTFRRRGAPPEQIVQKCNPYLNTVSSCILWKFRILIAPHSSIFICRKRKKM